MVSGQGVSTKFVANQITRFRDGFLPVNGVFLPGCLSLHLQSPETFSQSSCAKLSLETITTGFMYERFAAKCFHGMRFDGLSPLSATHSRCSSTRREGQSARPGCRKYPHYEILPGTSSRAGPARCARGSNETLRACGVQLV
jgi:hypothetical protein